MALSRSFYSKITLENVSLGTRGNFWLLTTFLVPHTTRTVRLNLGVAPRGFDPFLPWRKRTNSQSGG
jgi:hypothetical protein